jgi:hypothetical protein
MSTPTPDEQLVERVEDLYEELKKPIFVWAMAHGRLDNLLIDGASHDDHRVRGARTSIVNAARKMEAAVLQYQTKHP